MITIKALVESEIVLFIAFLVINILHSIIRLYLFSQIASESPNLLDSATNLVLFLIPGIKWVLLVISGYIFISRTKQENYYYSLFIGGIFSVLLFCISSVFTLFTMGNNTPSYLSKNEDPFIVQEVRTEQKNQQIKELSNSLKELSLRTLLYSGVTLSGGFLYSFVQNKRNKLT